jgi:tetratricopeptide (TPR) repeat protein
MAPTFLWHDAAAKADRWLVEITGEPDRLFVLVLGVPPPQGEIDPMALSSTNEVYEPTPYQASAKSWKPSPQVWQAIKMLSRARPVNVTFFGYRYDAPDKVVSRGRVSLTTSTDPVDAPIFYRDVPLMPPPNTKSAIMPLRKGALPLIKWRLRDISLPASRVMLTDMPTCANCHSFSADGQTMGMDIDGPKGDKGAYAISPIERQMVIENEEVISWNSFDDKPPGHKTLGFMSRMSPDGRYSVTTLNEKIYVANFRDYKFGQVFYPTRGILAYYSRDTGEIKALPGADDPDYVHVDPVWTPDGKSLIFARAKACDPFPEDRPIATYAGDPNETPVRYDLYRIPFNEGRGGRPEPIVGASDNGMSNNFAKVSPDGKWIVYVQCKNGLLMRPDSKLWIVPIDGGEARSMRCNTSLMNSWHSFSPNGRWLVFSSKSNTPYTQMFLTHLDEAGNDTPAVLIENSTAANRAVNIPEFINRPYDDFAGIYVEAVEHYRHYGRAQELSAQGRLEEAVSEYEKALEKDPGDSRFHVSLSQALLELGRYERAIEHTRKALEINPFNYEMHSNMGFFLARMGDVDTALKHLSAATRIHPRHPQGWYNRATLLLQQKDYDGALADYTEALRLQPRYPDALNGRGIVSRARGDLESALADFDSSIQMKPRAHTPRYFRALIRKETGDLPGALDDLNAALEAVPPDSPRREAIESLRRELLTALDSGAGDR